MMMGEHFVFPEATMSRDEWMSEGAAIPGILLVALGYWGGRLGRSRTLSGEAFVVMPAKRIDSSGPPKVTG